MTTLDELVDERIELDPDVPFPPFPIWLEVPATWSPLDSRPATWRRSADELITTTFRGSRLAPEERRVVHTFLEGLVADCQRAGAALSLIRVGRRATGGAASFGLHLAFADGGRPASLGRVNDMLPRSGTTSEIRTESGPAILHRDRMTMVVPGSAAIAALTSLQIFLPFDGTNWTVVLSTASAYPELTEALESMLRAIAASIRTGPDRRTGTAVGTPGDTPDPSAAEWVDTPTRATAPGFERGFGPTVTRRIDRAASGSTS